MIYEHLGGIKKTLVNYINILHVFSKNLGGGGGILKFMSKIIFINKKYKREGGFFEKSRGPWPLSPPPPPFLHQSPARVNKNK